MERLSTSLTNAIRSSSSREVVRGTAFSLETYVHVQWEWLIFPCILLVLTLVFLVATMVKTSKGAGESGPDIWKTSAMPSLVYSLPKEMQQQFNSSMQMTNGKGEEGTGKSIRLRLHPSPELLFLLRTHIAIIMRGWTIVSFASMALIASAAPVPYLENAQAGSSIRSIIDKVDIKRLNLGELREYPHYLLTSANTASETLRGMIPGDGIFVGGTEKMKQVLWKLPSIPGWRGYSKDVERSTEEGF
ncbi:hypothetical protein CC80DRAFT_596616 [Byssothecium circinans]|uniref:Uncharacterized protein n=1 Tax=Byssothecium circinans TaxID=147558 RepID=A0A6A5TIG1_9PLEO|nr:hypothetical protein CC80DRAFT_596616 [Byssothecium circinans]